MSNAATLQGNARFAARLKQRYRAERMFRALGLFAVAFSVLVLGFLLFTMTANGIAGFKRAELRFEMDLTRGGLTIDPAQLIGPGAVPALEAAGLPGAVTAAATKAVTAASNAQAAQLLESELADDAWREVAARLIADPALTTGKFTVSVPVSKDLASAMRDEATGDLATAAHQLKDRGLLVRAFDPGFLTRSDATDPQSVGIWGALKGSILTMFVTLILAFPVGVFAAVYLEEYAPKNRWTDVIEVSINNLAAVPSIIFGLLGLAVFLAIFPYYRSAPLIGGMTLALMTMPVIVISGRNAIKAVPPSIRDAALAVGASRVQTVFHHVLPLALPGILTGTIIGMARALGETAPLLMIGMRAFVATPPEGFTSPATVLPVQIFLWSDEIDRGFVERTSAAIIVLLLFLLAMNSLAIYLRNRFERRW
jgi:phosphate transport system permease protein